MFIGKKVLGTLFIILSILLLSGTSSAFTTEIEYSLQFITTKGNVTDSTEITDCWNHLNNLDNYSELDISVKSFDNKLHYIAVELDSDYKEEIDDARIDEIYQKINSACYPISQSDEIPVLFMWDKPVYSFYKGTKMSGFIEARGTIPEINGTEEAREWYGLLAKNTPVTVIEPYMSNGGHVVGFGTNINGYLAVYFDTTYQTTVNKSTIDEMYELIDQHYKKVGISDVPVLFVGGVETVLDVEPEGEASPETLPSDEDDKNVEDENNQAPGFTSIMLILGIAFVLKFGKR